MQIQPYLNFNGRCEEALEFYSEALGAQVSMMRYRESPDQTVKVEPGWDDKIIHASARIGDTEIMASDGCGGGDQAFRNISLALTVANLAEADRVFTALGEGGEVLMPLAETFFSPRFGMLTDRFGVMWLVVTAYGR